MAYATARQVLEELTKLALANMQDYMRIGPDGDPVLDFSNLTRDQAFALQEVTVDTYVVGRSKDAREVRSVKFKLVDKLGALVALGRHYKLFTDKNEPCLSGWLPIRCLGDKRMLAWRTKGEGRGNRLAELHAFIHFNRMLIADSVALRSHQTGA